MLSSLQFQGLHQTIDRRDCPLYWSMNLPFKGKFSKCPSFSWTSIYTDCLPGEFFASSFDRLVVGGYYWYGDVTWNASVVSRWGFCDRLELYWLGKLSPQSGNPESWPLESWWTHCTKKTYKRVIDSGSRHHKSWALFIFTYQPNVRQAQK